MDDTAFIAKTQEQLQNLGNKLADTRNMTFTPTNHK